MEIRLGWGRGPGLIAAYLVGGKRRNESFCRFSGAMFPHMPGPMTQTIQNVSDTAFMVAGFCAAESERPKPLFRDPLAAKLVGEHGKKILAAALRRRLVGRDPHR